MMSSRSKFIAFIRTKSEATFTSYKTHLLNLLSLFLSLWHIIISNMSFHLTFDYNGLFHFGSFSDFFRCWTLFQWMWMYSIYRFVSRSFLPDTLELSWWTSAFLDLCLCNVSFDSFFVCARRIYFWLLFAQSMPGKILNLVCFALICGRFIFYWVIIYSV